MKASQKEVYLIDRTRKCPQITQEDITFIEEDSWGVQHPHDDALVVTLVIANHRTRRVLIDNDSSIDILYLFTFEQMGIRRDKLWPTATPLVGFIGDRLYPTGIITLPVIAGVSPRQLTKVVDFLVIDFPSAYNAIIRRPMLNKMKAITSTYHLVMRFPTEEGVGEVRGNQTVVRECYVASLKEKSQMRPL